MSLKLSELPSLRAELHDLFEQADKIEKKYADGLITDEADRTKQSELLLQIKSKQKDADELQARITERDQIAKGLADYGTPPQATGASGAVGTARHLTKSLGQLFLESEGYVGNHKAGRFDGGRVPEFDFRVEGLSVFDLLRKDNLLYSGSGDPGTGVGDTSVTLEPFESRTRLPGIMPILRNPNTFLDMVPRVGTSEEIIEWVKENSFTNGADMIGEATAITGTTGLKPSSSMSFTVESTSVKDLAHWMVITNKMLRNESAMRGMIDTRLRLGLDLKLEDQILNGDGTGLNLLGLLDSGTGTQLRAQGGDSIPDAIRKAITMVRVTGFAQPATIWMNPLDWETVDLLRDEAGGSPGTGQYIWGGPRQMGPRTMWGIPVIDTPNLPQGTILVGDMRHTTLFDRERTNITVGRVDNQLIRNMQTILAEAAVAFVCFRPEAFCKITGVS